MKWIIAALSAFFMSYSLAFAGADPYTLHISRSYPESKALIEEYFPGIIGKELAVASVLRQGLEDGINRAEDLCINGMGVGGRNKEIVDSLIIPPWIKVTKITAYDGMLSYQIKGPGARALGTLAIAKWIDKHILELPSISKKDKEMWEKCKAASYLSTTPFYSERHFVLLRLMEPARLNLIDRVNGMYGPGGATLRGLKARLKRIFDLLD